MKHLSSKNPASIKSCVLLDKPSRRKVDLVPDYCGFTIEDKFVVGYGLNFGDYYRNVPYVYFSSKLQLGYAIGKAPRAALGVKDINFANKILELMETQKI